MKKKNSRVISIIITMVLAFTPFSPLGATSYGAEKSDTTAVTQNNVIAQGDLSSQTERNPKLPKDRIPPLTPADMFAGAGDQAVELSWTQNTESDFADYQLEYKTSKDKKWTKTILTMAAITVTNLTNGVEYQFRVKAVDTSSNWSSYSNIVIATPALVQAYGNNATLSAIVGGCGANHYASEGAFKNIVKFVVDGGTTTAYAIETPAQLQHMALHLKDNAILMTDLNFSGINPGTQEGTPMGDLNAAVASIGGSTAVDLRIASFTSGNFIPIGSGITDQAYRGIFYGNGKVISGLVVSGNTANNVGLFGFIRDGRIRDLGLSGGAVSGVNGVGGVAGGGMDSTIAGSYNTGSVSGVNGVGGLAGSLNYSRIVDSYNAGSVSGSDTVGGLAGYVGGSVQNSYNTGAISGVNNVGGVFGDMYKNIVVNSYNTGTVSGVDNVGGVGGTNGATVRDSYNTGTVFGSNNVGGVIGLIDRGYSMWGEINESYNTGSVSGQNNIGGVLGSTLRNGNIVESYNTGLVSGSNYIGGVVGNNESNETGTINAYWLEGMNLSNSLGIGIGIDTATAFAVDDSQGSTLSAIYASMSAITASANGNEAGTITDITASDNIIPIFNVGQGSYIGSLGSSITISADPDFELTYAIGSDLSTLLNATGSNVPESGVITTSPTDGPWLFIKAMSTDPIYNRNYVLYLK